jgi:uncharacterized protein YjiS (DUF1127 family)
MTALSSFLAAFRRGRIRRSAVRTLRGLSSEQLADLGIASDGIGDVVDGLIAREAALSVRTRTGSAVAAIGGLRGLGAVG